MAAPRPNPDAARRKDADRDKHHRAALESAKAMSQPNRRMVGEPLKAPWATDDDRAWWDQWRRSKMAENWGPVDWAYLEDTLHLRHAYYAKWERDGVADMRLLAEARLRLGLMGATVGDRQRLRMSVEKDARAVLDQAQSATEVKAAGPKVADFEERRRRLLGGA